MALAPGPASPPRAPRVAYYVSGHGYGHAVRAGEVARALAARGAAVTILSDAAAEAFGTLPPGVDRVPVTVDVGAVQRGSLSVDERATLDRVERLVGSWAGRAAREAKRLRRLGARVVAADIAPLGVLAARAAGLPSVVVANFSWDTIYRGWADRHPRAAGLADRFAEAYGHATLLLQTPLSGGLGAFPVRERIPLIARRSARPRGALRSALGIAPGALGVLVAFGGLGPPELAPPRDLPADSTRLFGYADLPWPADLYRRVDRASFSHPDLVRAADLLLGKPGYGTVAECALGRTPLAWLGRERFAEVEFLVEGIRNHVGGAEVESDAARQGRLWKALWRALATPPRGELLEGGGAEVAARRILDVAGEPAGRHVDSSRTPW